MGVFKLSEYTRLIVPNPDEKDLVWMCFEQFKEGCSTWKLFVSETVLKTIYSDLEHIQALIDQKTEGYVFICGMQRVVVSLWKEEIYVGLHKYENDVRICGRGMNFGLSEWYELVLQLSVILDSFDKAQYTWYYTLDSKLLNKSEVFWDTELACRVDAEKHLVSVNAGGNICHVLHIDRKVVSDLPTRYRWLYKKGNNILPGNGYWYTCYETCFLAGFHADVDADTLLIRQENGKSLELSLHQKVSHALKTECDIVPICYWYLVEKHIAKCAQSTDSWDDTVMTHLSQCKLDITAAAVEKVLKTL